MAIVKDSGSGPVLLPRREAQTPLANESLDNPAFASEEFKVIIACGLSSSVVNIYHSLRGESDKCCYLAPDFMYALEAGGRLLECVIIVDQDALTDAGLAQLRIRVSMSTGLRVLVLVREATLEYLSRLLRMGFSGFLQCDSSVDTVRKAIERVIAGELWADRKLMADALRGFLSIVNDRRFTRREIEILRKIAAGHNNNKIADDLFITRETVRWHLRSAYSKLGIHDREVAAGLLSRSITA